MYQQPHRPYGYGPTESISPRRPIWLIAVVAVVGAGLLAGLAAWFLSQSRDKMSAEPTSHGDVAPSIPVAALQRVSVGIAYGTEKRLWMEWAADQFSRTAEGANVSIDLIPIGSLEGARKVWEGDRRVQVWSPASSVYRNKLVDQWKVVRNTTASPILREEPLALTPMVFVMWESRYQAFKAKYGELNFTTLSAAMGEPFGWKTIAGQDSWGLFRFSHTHPQESNSGLVALALLAHDANGKSRDLKLEDVTANPAFVRTFEQVERNAYAPRGQLTNSTGNLMNEMVTMGASAYDCLLVYENVATDQLLKAEGRWPGEKLRIIYPKVNLWNDNPYYVLDVPWSTPEQRQAASAFLKFLTAEPAQRKAMEYGFRPANTAVALTGQGSPFERYQPWGLQLSPPGTFCPAPPAEVIDNLLLRWQTLRGGR